MAVSSPALRDALAEIVGSEHLSSDEAALASHAVDGVAPRWVARPGGVDEVSRLLALAAAERLAVVPRGSGSSLDLGRPPRRLDLVLDCRRLDDLVDYVAEDMVCTVAAGLTLQALGARLAQRRQRLPLDPPGGGSRSVGGVLSTGASGPLRFRYGTGRDLLLGVRFVQADGAVTWGGARVVKSVTGYDVPKLLVGSLGTLGVIVEATLRLHPIPPVSRTWLFPFALAERAGGFMAALLDSTLEPDRVALLNEGALRAAHVPAGPVAVAVGVESVEEAVVSQGQALSRLAHAHGSTGTEAPGDLWSTLPGARAGALGLTVVGEPRRLCFWLGEIERLAERHQLGVSAVGEAGSGVLQVALDGNPDADSLTTALLRPLREALAPEGGSVVVERAPLAWKASLDVWGPVAPELLAIMTRIKGEFDPLGILNPGRFVGGL